MSKQMTISSRAWGEMLLLSTIWGASFLSIRIALNDIGPLTAVAHRTFWAMLALWAYIMFARLDIPRKRRVWFAFFVMGLLNNAIPFSLMAWGQLHIETGLTSILNASTAVFGVIAAALFLADEKLTTRKLCGTLIGFAGVVTAVGVSALTSLDLRSWGQLAVIGGTISYALAGVWARKMLAGLAPQVAAAGMLTGSTLIMVPLAYSVEGPFRFDLAPQTWAAIMYYAFIATAVAYLLYYRVLGMAGSGNLMISTLIVAPIAIVLGAVVLHEALPLRAYAGFGLLVTGLLILDGRLAVAVKNRARRA